jgi:hypothetical protein
MKRVQALPGGNFTITAVGGFHPGSRAGSRSPSHEDPGSRQWDAWGDLGSSSVGIMIVNLNNGDDTNYYANIDLAVRNTRRRGSSSSVICTRVMDSVTRSLSARKLISGGRYLLRSGSNRL